MSAPFGNDYWKRRSKHGRDAVFANAELLRTEAVAFIEWCAKNPLIKVEQTTGKSRPMYDELTGEMYVPEALTHIPVRRPLTMVGFCRWLGCSEDYFRTTKKVSKDKEVIEAIQEIEAVVFADQQEGGLAGLYNANFVARLQQIADNAKNELSGPGGGPIETSRPLDDSEFEKLYIAKYGRKPDTNGD